MRAVILDKLQLDVFRWYWKHGRPELATFFLNSTAHYQHCYWRNMDPGPFQVKPSEAEIEQYGQAIEYGYTEMDKIVGEFLKLAGPDTTVVLATALSQQPCLKYEAKGGAHFHRPVDFAVLAKFAGIDTPHLAAPVMTHQFNVDFESEVAAADAEQKFRALRVGGRPALQVERAGERRIHLGSCIYRVPPKEARLTSELNDRSAGFFDVFYLMETTKSGMHHPDGILWIRTPDLAPAMFTDKVPLSAIAPTILGILGLPKPATMKAEPIRLEPATC